MDKAKTEVSNLLNRLPDSVTIEDIQYHLYVLEKINRSLERTKKEGAIDHEEVKKRFSKWLIK